MKKFRTILILVNGELTDERSKFIKEILNGSESIAMPPEIELWEQNLETGKLERLR